jgi:hypothetical protein
MTFLDLLLIKYGSHEKLAKAANTSRQVITYQNQIKCVKHRNSYGIRLILDIGEDFNESFTNEGVEYSFKFVK